MTGLRRLPRLQRPEDVRAALGIPFSGEQLAAIAAPLEPGVIVAGAGTGKTTVMAARVVWLVGSGQVRPDEILGLTFTRKAAGELADRIARALAQAGFSLGTDEAGETVMTYDAFAGAVLAEHGARIGVPSSRRLLGEAAAFRLAASVVERFDAPLPRLGDRQPATVIGYLRDLDAQLASHLVDVAAVEEFNRRLRADLAAVPADRRGKVPAALRDAGEVAAARAELLDLVRAYRARKADADVAEFADQMAAVARLVTAVPGVGADLRQRFRVVLLDEYQDTSAAQVLVLRSLFSGPDPASGRGFPVTAVGDPLQAIYGWRGASASNIGTFPRDFPAADGSPATGYTLTVNRRSRPEILAVANAVAADLRAAGVGHELVAPKPDPHAPVPPRGRVTVGQFESRGEEIEWICDRILALRATPADRGGVARWDDIAVLTRANADAAQIHERLRERDVPAEIVGLGGLLDVPEVADVIATLRVVHDVSDNAATVRLLTGPRWRIADADLAALGHRAARLDDSDVPSLLTALEDPGPAVSAAARERCARLAAELRGLRERQGYGLADLVHRCIASLGLDVELAASPELVQRGGRRQLTAFVDVVADYVEFEPDAALGGFLAFLEAARDEERGLEVAPVVRGDAVQLLTVHRAKGLEWDVVFLPFLTAGAFPGDRVDDNWLRRAHALPAPLRGDADSLPRLQGLDKAAFETYADALRAALRSSEDRLAYVGASRARRGLNLTASWWKRDASRPKRPSDYLLAAWPHAAEVVSDVAEPGPDAASPCADAAAPVPWAAADPARLERSQALAAEVVRLGGRHAVTGQWPSDPPAMLDDEARIAAWDQEQAALLAEARALRAPWVTVPLPESLTTSQMMSAARDPQAFAAQLVRPMPLAPSRAARFGTRFHEWVERRFVAETLPGMDSALETFDAAVGSDLGTDAALGELCEQFAAGRFGERAPYAVEHSFSIWLGRLVRGRIDAVYAEPDGRWLVVDWKTNAAASADPLQLAVYRVAWAEWLGVDPDRVRAGFYYVRRDELSVLGPEQELSRTQLEQAVARLGGE